MTSGQPEGPNPSPEPPVPANGEKSVSPGKGGDFSDAAHALNRAFLIFRGFLTSAHALTVYGLATVAVAIWLRIEENQWIHSAEFVALTAFAAVLVIAGVVARIFESRI